MKSIIHPYHKDKCCNYKQLKEAKQNRLSKMMLQCPKMAFNFKEIDPWAWKCERGRDFQQFLLWKTVEVGRGDLPFFVAQHPLRRIWNVISGQHYYTNTNSNDFDADFHSFVFRDPFDVFRDFFGGSDPFEDIFVDRKFFRKILSFVVTIRQNIS